jgi:aldose 1-epimerase
VNGVFQSPERPAEPPPPCWDWRTDPLVDTFVDHQFDGWDGVAKISWPSRDLALTLTAGPATSRLVVYAPVGESYFCVEPVSHQLDGVNRSPGGGAHGMTLLAAGETLTMTARFSIEPDFTLADARAKRQR